MCIFNRGCSRHCKAGEEAVFISLSQSVCIAYDAFKEVSYGKTMYGVKTVMIRSNFFGINYIP